MDRPEANQSIVFKVIATVAISASLWLGVCAFLAVQRSTTGTEEASFDQLNPFIQPVSSPENEQKIAELSKQLEFMVWSEERRQLGAELTTRLRAQINETPFNGYLWRALSYAQKDAGLSASEQAWVIERAELLLGWNKRERLILAHHCFVNHSLFHAFSTDFCHDQLSKLPSMNSIGLLAVSVGVSSERAKWVFDKEGITFSEGK